MAEDADGGQHHQADNQCHRQFLFHAGFPSAVHSGDGRAGAQDAQLAQVGASSIVVTPVFPAKMRETYRRQIIAAICRWSCALAFPALFGNRCDFPLALRNRKQYTKQAF